MQDKCKFKKCKTSANARQKHLLKVATLSVQLAAIVILYSLRLWEGGVADVIGGGRFEYVFGMVHFPNGL